MSVFLFQKFNNIKLYKMHIFLLFSFPISFSIPCPRRKIGETSLHVYINFF
jgi:hypothetical protein